MPQMPLRRIIVGNWKMHGLRRDLAEATDVARGMAENVVSTEVVICPPATLLPAMSLLLADSGVLTGGQTCDAGQSAHTGAISAAMLADAGAHYVLLGHSERRRQDNETSAVVAAKAAEAARAKLHPIVCVGETRAQRDSGRTLAILREQLVSSCPAELQKHAFDIAYEPTWAIGAGVTPSTSEIQAAHCALRDVLTARFPDSAVRILYGGSVDRSNAKALLDVAGVDGLLVGRASRCAADFLPLLLGLDSDAPPGPRNRTTRVN